MVDYNDCLLCDNGTNVDCNSAGHLPISDLWVCFDGELPFYGGKGHVGSSVA